MTREELRAATEIQKAISFCEEQRDNIRSCIDSAQVQMQHDKPSIDPDYWSFLSKEEKEDLLRDFLSRVETQLTVFKERLADI